MKCTFQLKNSKFEHLRESRQHPQSICPSLNQSLAVIREMVDQVMALHPDARFLHIGCDEVYQLAECARCSARAAEFRSGTILKDNYM